MGRVPLDVGAGRLRAFVVAAAGASFLAQALAELVRRCGVVR